MSRENKNINDETTQVQKIMRHFQLVGSITTLQAVQEYGILRLASRIWDIKQLGFRIEDCIVESTNRFGERVHFKKYWLHKCEHCGNRGWVFEPMVDAKEPCTCAIGKKWGGLDEQLFEK